MTPEQVATASNGDVTVLAKGQRQTDAPTKLETGAAGTGTDGPAKVVVTFLFDRTGRLQCVRMAPPPKDARQSTLIKGMAVMQYGAPRQQAAHAGGETDLWMKPADAITMDIVDGGTVAYVLDCKP